MKHAKSRASRYVWQPKLTRSISLQMPLLREAYVLSDQTALQAHRASAAVLDCRSAMQCVVAYRIVVSRVG